ncbi:MAG: branched-chain amino acid ABC transporter substrate-binding protein [Chloroflexota bacterium]
MKLRHLSAVAATMVMVVACGGTTTPTAAPTNAPSAGPTSTATGGGGTIAAVKIGVDLPLSGNEVANGKPTLQGIQLAVAQWNDASMGHSYTVDTNVQDDAVNGLHDPQKGAANANTLVSDDQVVGMVGPFNSNVSRAIIPVTNEFGLAQCSPSNTGVDLTKEGSEQYRPAHPDVRNYFRVATPDDIQGPAGAQYAYNDLGARTALVIDDTQSFGVGVANTFTTEFETLGGTTLPRVSNDFAVNTSFAAILTTAQGQGDFDVVYFGGTQVTGGGQLRKDMGAAGLLDVPLVGPDGITTLGKGGDQGEEITLAGEENAANIHGTVAGIHDIPDPAAFAADYGAMFNGETPGAYSALAYACTQVLLQAVDAHIAAAADLAALREAVRAAVFAGDTWQTVLGPINFDPNGDSSQKFISFYKTDMTLNDGHGGWVYVKQQDFAQ